MSIDNPMTAGEVHSKELHGNFPAGFPRVTAGNPAGEGTERAGYPREGK